MGMLSDKTFKKILKLPIEKSILKVSTYNEIKSLLDEDIEKAIQNSMEKDVSSLYAKAAYIYQMRNEIVEKFDSLRDPNIDSGRLSDDQMSKLTMVTSVIDHWQIERINEYENKKGEELK